LDLGFGKKKQKKYFMCLGFRVYVGFQLMKTQTPKPYATHNPNLYNLELASMGWKAKASLVADIVNYLVYMSEPYKQQDKRLGLLVLGFLALLLVLTYLLKKEFWKDLD
jgi:ubiquinol-cytochrome c reductase cytochrome c1 subunit